MALAITYGLYVAVFQKPVLFSSFYFAWFFNPHIGYVAEGPAGNEYHCPLHSGHNIALLVVLTGTYLFMGLALAYKIHFTMTTGSNQSLEIFARHKMVFPLLLLT
jgi:hypothetical protein